MRVIIFLYVDAGTGKASRLVQPHADLPDNWRDMTADEIGLALGEKWGRDELPPPSMNPNELPVVFYKKSGD